MSKEQARYKVRIYKDGICQKVVLEDKWNDVEWVLQSIAITKNMRFSYALKDMSIKVFQQILFETIVMKNDVHIVTLETFE